MTKSIKILTIAACALLTATLFVGCKQVEALQPMPTITIDGHQYQINQSTIKDMEVIFTTEASKDRKFIEPGDPQHFTLTSNKNDKMIVGVYNDTNASMEYNACKIHEITINKSRFDKVELVFSNGASFNSDMNDITEKFGESSSSTSDGLSTTYCWLFSDGTLYVTVETGQGNILSFRMLSNVDPHTALAPEAETTEPTK